MLFNRTISYFLQNNRKIASAVVRVEAWNELRRLSSLRLANRLGGSFFFFFFVSVVLF